MVIAQKRRGQRFKGTTNQQGEGKGLSDIRMKRFPLRVDGLREERSRKSWYIYIGVHSEDGDERGQGGTGEKRRERERERKKGGMEKVHLEPVIKLYRVSWGRREGKQQFR